MKSKYYLVRSKHIPDLEEGYVPQHSTNDDLETWHYQVVDIEAFDQDLSSKVIGTHYQNVCELPESFAKLIMQSKSMYEILKKMNAEISNPMQFLLMQADSRDIIKKIENRESTVQEVNK